MQGKIFWAIYLILSTITGFYLPLIWGLVANVPLIILSWWIVYKSGWFD